MNQLTHKDVVAELREQVADLVLRMPTAERIANQTSDLTGLAMQLGEVHCCVNIFDGFDWFHGGFGDTRRLQIIIRAHTHRLWKLHHILTAKTLTPLRVVVAVAWQGRVFP